MAITMASIFNKVKAILDEYTEDGVLVPESETLDMQNKVILFADMAQKELYDVGRMEKTFKFAYNPPQNLLGRQFDQVDFVGADQTYEAVGAKAYYFEADDTGSVVIEEYDGALWNTLSTVILDGTGTYKAFTGTITATDDSYPVRLRFTGTTHYRHINRALFVIPYKLARIPIYKPWFSVMLPSDFMDIDQIVSEDYETANFRWEKPNALYFEWGKPINYRMVYSPIPTTIANINATLECNEIIGQAIVYYCVANVAPYENTSLVNTAWQKFSELKAIATKRQPTTWQKIKPSFTIGGEY